MADVFRPTCCLGQISGSRARAREPVNIELNQRKNKGFDHGSAEDTFSLFDVYDREWLR